MCGRPLFRRKMLSVLTNLGSFYLMKMRKFTAFIIAVVAILATFSFLTPASGVYAADPAGTEADFINGYKYYYSNFVFEKLNEKLGEADKANYAKYTYKFSFTLKGASEEDKTNATKYTVKSDKNGLTGDGEQIKFKAAGEYEATVFGTAIDKDADTDTEVTGVTFTVADYDDTKDYLKISYNNPDEVETENALKTYLADVQEAAKKDYGGDFVYPSVKSLVTTSVLDYKNLKLTLYYMTPDSSSFSSTSSSSTSGKKFELSTHGTYVYYVTLADPEGNGVVFDYNKYEAETRADATGRSVVWLKEDETDKYYIIDKTPAGNETGITVRYVYEAGTNKVVCPVFSFDFNGTKTPEIVIDSNNVHKGCKGLTYKEIKEYITVVSVDNSQTEYRLYYSKVKLSDAQLADGQWKKTFDAALDTFDADNVTNSLYDVTDVKAFAFDQSARTFMVAENGYYYVACAVANEFGDASGYLEIEGTNTLTKISYARNWGEFFKNNTTSVIFLGIAVLSFIGLLLVIFIKPKQTEIAENDTPKKKG